jgi:entericidin A
MNYIKKIVIVSLLLTAVGLLNGCGTVNGFGKDVSTAGHDIQKAAN